MAVRYHDYHYVNGRGRNEVVKLSDEELFAMASELRSHRRTDKTSRWARRREYLNKIKGEQDEQI